jgi:hypothetical protein
MSSFKGVSFGCGMSRAVSISMVIDYKSMGGGDVAKSVGGLWLAILAKGERLVARPF